MNPTTEFNNSDANDNMAMVNVTLEDTTAYTFEIGLPMAGQYNVANRTDIELEAMITNTGTLEIPAGWHINVSYENLDDASETKINHTNAATPSSIPSGGDVMIDLGNWDALLFDYNANFRLTFTLSETLGTVDVTQTVDVTLAGGPANGSLMGTVVDAADVGIPGVMVSVWDEDSNLVASATTTGGTYHYDIEVPGAPEGINYTVSAKSYWYAFSESDIVMARSGRDTIVPPLVLTEKPKGMINGTITLAGMAGGPEAEQDWTGVTVEVEGTEDTSNTFSPDAATGMYDEEAVAGTGLNVSSAKAHFAGAYNDSVDITADENVTVDLTLVELWNVTVTPGNGSEVAKDVMIQAIFDEVINTSTITIDNFTIMYDNAELVGLNHTHYTWSDDMKTFNITPTGLLVDGMTYEIVLNTNIKRTDDTDAIHRIWSTEFKIPMGTGAVEGWVTDADTGDPLAGVNVSIPNTDFYVITDAQGKYTLSGLIAGAHNMNASLVNYVLKQVPITIVPGETVVVNITLSEVAHGLTYTPADGAIDQPLDTVITVTFSTAMNGTTVNDTTFTLSSAAGAVAGTIATLDNTTFVFTPAALTENTPYTWMLMAEIMAAGATENWYHRDLSFTFTTVEKGPTPPITVTQVTPADGTTDIPLDTTIIIVFDTPINDTSFIAAFTVSSVSGTVVGASVWSDDDMSVTFTPTADLLEGTTYTCTIAAATLKPLTGDAALASDYSWSFTTISGPEPY
jgi:hypothetical protein